MPTPLRTRKHLLAGDTDMKSCRGALIFVLLIAVSGCLTAQGHLQIALKVGQPVAIDGLPSVGLFVLTRNSVVFHYAPVGNALEFRNRFENIQYGNSNDITIAETGGQQSVLITSWSDHMSRGYVSRYAPDGRFINTWMVRKVPIGIDFDTTSGYAYFAAGDSGEVFKLNIRDPKADAKFVCEIPGAQGLGSLVVDPGHSAYVADTQTGTISRVDLTTARVTSIAHVSQPSALRYDGQKHLLYVADGIAHRILAIDVAKQASAPVPVVPERVSTPSGLAPGFNGAILISDFKTDSVYQAMPDLTKIR
jgi:DNA-binding beta-propeller fold protein YncE